MVLPALDWSFEELEKVIPSSFFEYKRVVKFDKESNILQLEYRYKTLSDHVLPVDFDQYLSDIEKVRNDVQYAISAYASGPDPALASEPANEYNLYLIGLIIAFLLILYVLIEWIYDIRKAKEETLGTYYPVSVVKLFVLSVVTFGVYSWYWFYKNWVYVKRRDASNIMPMARTFFSYFWYYPLFKDLLSDSQRRYVENRIFPNSVGVVMAALYLLSCLGGYGILTIPCLMLAAALLIPLANYINHIEQNTGGVIPLNSRWRPRHFILSILSIPIFVLMIGGDIGLLANSQVVKGDLIWKHDIKFMNRKGILPAGERLVYFYSDATFNIREDGNGFSDEHVFSYWLGDDGELLVERAPFSDIKDIKTSYSKGRNDNTTITVTTGQGLEFVLYVGSEDMRDRVFIEALNERWAKARSENGNTEP